MTGQSFSLLSVLVPCISVAMFVVPHFAVFINWDHIIGKSFKPLDRSKSYHVDCIGSVLVLVSTPLVLVIMFGLITMALGVGCMFM